MQKYVKIAEQLFVKYGIASPDTTDTHRTFRDRLRRVDLLMDGQRQLDDILSTLKNCNDGLLTIAPPAPGYYVSLAGNDPILETSNEAQYLGEEALRRPQAPQSASQSSSLPMNDRRAETAPQTVSIPSLDPSVQEVAKKAFHPVIELLYSTCVRVLRSTVLQYPSHKETFQGVGDRLEIWGTGLFQGQVSIDQALDQKSKVMKMLKNNIAGILADVSVILRERLHICFPASNGVSDAVQSPIQ